MSPLWRDAEILPPPFGRAICVARITRRADTHRQNRMAESYKETL